MIYGNSPRSYSIVYAKNLRLHKGVDNRIQFKFINQEQKPVDITGAEITMRILNSDGTQVLIQKALTLVYALTGLAELQLLSSELDSVESQKGYYSLEIPSNSFNVPVFLDNDSAARGIIWIEDSVLPKHMPSMNVTIPSHPVPQNNTVTFTSSTVSTSYNPKLTLQAYYNNFSGTVQVQGSTIPDNDWYNINDPITYINQANTDYYQIEGFHPYIRVQFNCTQGDVTDILAR